ncbi:hypothetical protein [Pseudomonas brassicacearum]
MVVTAGVVFGFGLSRWLEVVLSMVVLTVLPFL